MTDYGWIVGTPAELLQALRPGGWVMGHSGMWPQYLLRLHKTDLMRDLRKLPQDHRCIWRIRGNPEQNGHYAEDRRTVVIWLGKA